MFEFLEVIFWVAVLCGLGYGLWKLLKFTRAGIAWAWNGFNEWSTRSKRNEVVAVLSMYVAASVVLGYLMKWTLTALEPNWEAHGWTRMIFR